LIFNCDFYFDLDMGLYIYLIFNNSQNLSMWITKMSLSKSSKNFEIITEDWF